MIGYRRAALLAGLFAGPASAQQTPPRAPAPPQTRAQVEAQAAATHQRLDLNGDGYVTVAEMMQVLAPRPDPAERQPSLRRLTAEQLFREADADGDGRISQAEQRAAADRAFTLADVDHDSLVTAQEAVAVMLAKVQAGSAAKR